MKKLCVLILLCLSTLIFGQNWQSNNPYNNPTRGPYDNLSKNSERQINQEMSDLKKIINSSRQIYEHFKDDNDVAVQEESDSVGPGAPGEPVPINQYQLLLLLSGFVIALLSTKRLKQTT